MDKKELEQQIKSLQETLEVQLEIKRQMFEENKLDKQMLQEAVEVIKYYADTEAWVSIADEVLGAGSKKADDFLAKWGLTGKGEGDEGN
jgi:hypothetical protein